MLPCVWLLAQHTHSLSHTHMIRTNVLRTVLLTCKHIQDTYKYLQDVHAYTGCTSTYRIENVDTHRCVVCVVGMLAKSVCVVSVVGMLAKSVCVLCVVGMLAKSVCVVCVVGMLAKNAGQGLPKFLRQ